MSSLIRRIQRQVVRSQPVHRHLDDDGKPTGKPYANPPRHKFWQGRGDKLGVNNPQDKALLARQKRETRHAQA